MVERPTPADDPRSPLHLQRATRAPKPSQTGQAPHIRIPNLALFRPPEAPDCGSHDVLAHAESVSEPWRWGRAPEGLFPGGLESQSPR